MRSIILFIPLFFFLISPSFAQEKTDSTILIKRPVDVGLVYPLSTNGINAADYDNKVSLQAIAGVSGAITGCALAGVANIIVGNSKGGAFAGILNTIGNNAAGAQFAGIANIVSHNATGMQAAGIFNTAGSMTGIQLAGIGNITSGKGKAIQAAGIFNRADSVRTQLAGVLNIAKKVSGIQMSGLINIADSSDYAIGFINLIKNGEQSIGISAKETGNILLSFYSGSKHFYGIMGLGYQVKDQDDLYALQAGLGAHLFNTGKRFRLNAEALQLVQTDFKNGHAYTYTIQVLPEIKLFRSLSLFAGPSVNLILDYSDQKISRTVNHYTWTTSGRNGHFIGGYFGATGGLKWIL